VGGGDERAVVVKAWVAGRRAGRATGQLGLPTEKPDPFRSRLDAKVERVELSLRRLIAERLDGDHSFLPPHVTERVQDRVAAAARKLPDDSAPRLTTLNGQLEYFDLRELQDVITSKSLWPRFEPTFRTKETVAVRFGQLAELRNAIRHSRTLTDVAIKDGEAAILWFDGMLCSAES
jgi:hypothetical protein